MTLINKFIGDIGLYKNFVNRSLFINDESFVQYPRRMGSVPRVRFTLIHLLEFYWYLLHVTLVSDSAIDSAISQFPSFRGLCHTHVDKPQTCRLAK